MTYQMLSITLANSTLTTVKVSSYALRKTESSECISPDWPDKRHLLSNRSEYQRARFRHNYHPDMKWHEQVTYAVCKASRMWSVLKKTFKSRDPKLWKKLYTAYVRPQLEFAVAAWNPYQRGDISLLERVQRRVTRVPRKLVA